MTVPSISVVIPVFNGEKTIKETILSALQQSFIDFEILVINDGSQDATLEILEKIRDPRLQIFSYPNVGLAESRNRGIARAQGEFIAFLDADDLWTADKLESQWQALKNTPDAAVAYSLTNYIDESSQFVKEGQHKVVNGNVLEELLINNFIENGSNPLICKQAFERVGEFESSLKKGEDWDMWLRLAREFHFVAVPAVQVLYRISDSSMSTDVRDQERQCLKVIDRAFSRVPDSLQSLKQKSLVNLYRYLSYKAIEGPPSRQKGVVAARCFWKYIRYNPALLKQGKMILGMVWRISLMLLLPPKQAQTLLDLRRPPT
ncbi:MAG: glycosyltransferase [Cyanobacteriota bacterium]|nr:glycosyltransferase [Cyanobacteriota bacterium]